MSERASTDGPAGEVSYLSWPGRADTTPVLFLHPVNTAAAVWERVADAWGSGRPMLAVDYRGHGRSMAASPCFPVDYAADALAVLAAAGVRRAHLVVGSIGGAVAVELAAAAPAAVASISAFGAGIRVQRPRDEVDGMVAALRYLGVRAWFERHGGEILGPASRPEAAEELVAVAVAGRDGDRPLESVVEALATTFALADSRPAGRQVALAPPPSRVFVGSHDPTCPEPVARELADHLGAAVVELRGIGHLPMLEDPAGTAAAASAFVAEVEGAA